MLPELQRTQRALVSNLQPSREFRPTAMMSEQIMEPSLKTTGQEILDLNTMLRFKGTCIAPRTSGFH